MSSDSSPSVKRKQEQVLLELSGIVNTLAGIEQVLQDIIALTEEVDSDDGRNVAFKQKQLLKELMEWKHVAQFYQSGTDR